jgi:hypothetical protein
MTKAQEFARRLKRDLEDEKIIMKEYALLFYMFQCADQETGNLTTKSGTLAANMHLPRTMIRDIMTSLRRKGYLVRSTELSTELQQTKKAARAHKETGEDALRDVKINRVATDFSTDENASQDRRYKRGSTKPYTISLYAILDENISDIGDLSKSTDFSTELQQTKKAARAHKETGEDALRDVKINRVATDFSTDERRLGEPKETLQQTKKAVKAHEQRDEIALRDVKINRQSTKISAKEKERKKESNKERKKEKEREELEHISGSIYREAKEIDKKSSLMSSISGYFDLSDWQPAELSEIECVEFILSHDWGDIQAALDTTITARKKFRNAYAFVCYLRAILRKKDNGYVSDQEQWSRSQALSKTSAKRQALANLINEALGGEICNQFRRSDKTILDQLLKYPAGLVIRVASQLDSNIIPDDEAMLWIKRRVIEEGKDGTS